MALVSQFYTLILRNMEETIHGRILFKEIRYKFSIFRCLFMGTRRCDGSISEDARNIPANTPLRQRMELLVKTAEKEKKKQ